MSASLPNEDGGDVQESGETAALKDVEDFESKQIEDVLEASPKDFTEEENGIWNSPVDHNAINMDTQCSSHASEDGSGELHNSNASSESPMAPENIELPPEEDLNQDIEAGDVPGMEAEGLLIEDSSQGNSGVNPVMGEQSSSSLQETLGDDDVLNLLDTCNEPEDVVTLPTEKGDVEMSTRAEELRGGELSEPEQEEEVSKAMSDVMEGDDASRHSSVAGEAMDEHEEEGGAEVEQCELDAEDVGTRDSATSDKDVILTDEDAGTLDSTASDQDVALSAEDEDEGTRDSMTSDKDVVVIADAGGESKDSVVSYKGAVSDENEEGETMDSASGCNDAIVIADDDNEESKDFATSEKNAVADVGGESRDSVASDKDAENEEGGMMDSTSGENDAIIVADDDNEESKDSAGSEKDAALGAENEECRTRDSVSGGNDAIVIVDDGEQESRDSGMSERDTNILTADSSEALTAGDDDMVDEDKLLASEPGEDSQSSEKTSTKQDGGDNRESESVSGVFSPAAESQSSAESLGLQISAVMSGDALAELGENSNSNKDTDKAETGDDTTAVSSQAEGDDKDNDAVEVMNIGNDSNSTPVAKVVSESRTSTEESMEVDDGEKPDQDKDVEETGEEAKTSTEDAMETEDNEGKRDGEATINQDAEKEGEDKESGETGKTTASTVENVISESTDSDVGFKIVSVTAGTGEDEDKQSEEHENAEKGDESTEVMAADGEKDQNKAEAATETDKSDEEQTSVKPEPIDVDAVTESESASKTDAEKKDEEKGDSGPKIVETTSLSTARVTRSHSQDMAKAATPPKTKPGSSSSGKGPQTCIVCKKVGKCKYNIVRNGDVKHLCDDKCFKEFRWTPTRYLRNQSEKNSSPTPTPAPKTSSNHSKYRTCTVCQLMNVNPTKPFLNMSGMDFCGEECLGKFKTQLKSMCGQCNNPIPKTQTATYCLKVGSETKQFCKSDCYIQFKNKRKTCAYCKKDVAANKEAFISPVGKKGEFKDFCCQLCLDKFNKEKDDDVEIIGVQPGKDKEVACAVCSKVTKPKHELTFEGKVHKMCSDPCYSAFQYANKLTSNTCDNCGVYCYGEGSSPQFIQFEGHQKRFCGTTCVDTFRTANKKMVQCAWCGSRKNNFDMIERVDANNKYQLFCSLNCLSLYRVNLQATSNQSVTCDQCRKFVPAQYHLTMSDASVRNFCSYSCVMTFQGQFSAGQKKGGSASGAVTQNSATPAPQPQPAKKTVATRTSGRVASMAASAPVPVISNVMSLAPQSGASQSKGQTVNIKSTGQMPVIVTSQAGQVKTTTTGSQPNLQQQIIIQPPPPKQVKNKSLLCKPYVQTKATSCRPHTQSKGSQTDEESAKQIFVPIPVPIYIPTPMAMYTAPTPLPLPFPVPIPIPCFIPTTKKSASSILKHIKEIQERIPADPFEAELLMMAEAVANAEKGSDDESDKSDEEPADSLDNEPEKAEKEEKKAVDNEIGEDMLQMALRMASEMDEPMDLETSVDPVPINRQPEIKEVPQEDGDEDYVPPAELTGGGEDDIVSLLSPRELRARKRKGTGRRGGRGGRRTKRQKYEPEEEEEPVAEQEDSNEATAVAKNVSADTNFLLKYMYGVNAWKHWVVQKNGQLEKVKQQGSGRVKLFKTELLQCTADELNYSLCLFVKEVRKPNSEEYAADSILYLCLGIQNYLFENGRIDNIFTDIYYEKFTECLNEVVQRFEPKLNTSGQLVCRIEEEHLWECKQLGAHSPYVLLNTLVYFNTKYFMLKSPEDHMKLSFSHIMKHWKKNPLVPVTPGNKGTGGRSVYLRYYVTPFAKAPNQEVKDVKKKKDETPIFEQAENLDNPLRCPVKLYEFYLSKCPESIKARNDVFYLVPERSCVPDSPVWYSTQAMTIEPMAKMLHRIHMVKEVQEAYLHTSPTYV